MAYKPPIPKLIPQGNGTFSVRGWKVCVPGYWRGELMTPARIKGIVNTYQHLKSKLGHSFSPKARLGHDRHQRLATSMGLPNAGRVTDVRSTPDDGFEIDIDSIPEKVLTWNPDENRNESFDLFKAFQNRNYDSGSIELKRTMIHPTDPRQKLFDVFDGIAFLGEEHPAIKTSAPIGFADSFTLAFSDFQEEPPMTPQEKLAQIVAGLTPEQATAMLQQLGGGDALTGCCTPTPAPAPVPGGAPEPDADNKISMSADFKAFKELMTARLNATEAANEDLRKQILGQQVSGLVTMSEAYKRIDACVASGKVSKQLADLKYKPEAKDLLSLPIEKAVFADGENKGRAQIALFLEQLESRPADVMFSEIIDDTTPKDGPTSPEILAILKMDAKGREALDYAEKLKKSAA